MSLRNQHWITLSGEPITGMTPTRVRVFSDTPGLVMNAQQEGFVAHAYKLFCDAINISAFPNGYHLQNRIAPDGTTVRMESNLGMHRVTVHIRDEKKEADEYLLSSPRAFGTFTDGNFFDGDPANKPVYTYRARKNSKPKQTKKQTFKEASQYANLARQPGNRVWVDDRAEGKQISKTVSWWGRVYTCGTEVPINASDRAAALNASVAWYVEYTHPAIYVDFEHLGDLQTYYADEPLLCAALHKSAAGVTTMRVVTTETYSPKLRLYEFAPGDIGDQSKYTVTVVPLEYAPKTLVGHFNASATKFCYIGEDPASSYAQCVVEVDFATATLSYPVKGTLTVETADFSIPSPSNTNANFDGYVTGSSVGGVDSYSATKPPTSFVSLYHLAQLWRVPVACAYVNDELVYVEARDREVQRYDLNDTHSGSYSVTQTTTSSGSPVMYTVVRDGDVSATYSRDETFVVSLQTAYVQVRGATEVVLHDSGLVPALSWSRTSSGSTSYGWDNATVTSETLTYPERTYDSRTFNDQSGFDTTAKVRKTCLLLWEPRAEYALVAECAVSLGWKDTGRYQQRVTFEQYAAGRKTTFQAYNRADTASFTSVKPAVGTAVSYAWPPVAEGFSQTLTGNDCPQVGGGFDSTSGASTVRLGIAYANSMTFPSGGFVTGRNPDFCFNGAVSYSSACSPRKDMVAAAAVAWPHDGTLDTAVNVGPGGRYVRPSRWFPGVNSAGYLSGATYGPTLCHIATADNDLEAKTAVRTATGASGDVPSLIDRFWWSAPIFVKEQP